MRRGVLHGLLDTGGVNRMINKKIIITGFVFLIGIFLISSVHSADVSYCCEKTAIQNDGSGGAWCQNAPQEQCDANFRKTPTSCESTSYCKKGTCYDSQEGTCDPNTPQKSCEDSGGVWEDKNPEDLPQCQLGCCLIGDQAAFVTQTRCKRLSSLYGLTIDFRTSTKDEMTCLASAASDAKGACVFTKDSEKTCIFTTKKNCLAMETSETDVSFHEDYLCSAESLGTNCGPTKQTKCVEGRDEVYFVDSCGNLANIYDASKINDKTYWSKIVAKEDICGVNDEDGNADSRTCGNCDYYLGSTCKVKGSGDASPQYGNNICRDLDCVYKGKTYKHGETWCEGSEGVDKNLPGSRDYRLVCYNGEVTIEPCADFRQEVCVQSEVNGFKTSACRVSQWQDCFSQKNKQDCENSDKRDCKWVQTIWQPKPGDNPGIIKSNGGACVPLYTPGFDFWNPDGDTQALCSSATTKCVVKFKKKITSSRCIENCECLTSTWQTQMKGICEAVGDCGSTTNYIGQPGYK